MSVRGRLLLVGTLLLVALTIHTEARTSIPSVALEACQKVARTHAVLLAKTVNTTMVQLGDTIDDLECYLKRWVEKVNVKGDTDASGCVTDFRSQVAKVQKEVSDSLNANVRVSTTWYDNAMFRLLTDVLSQEQQREIVRSTEFHLEPALKEFTIQAASLLKASVKRLKASYSTAAFCIRQHDVKGQRSN